MDEKLKALLTGNLSEVIDDWMSHEIECGEAETEDYPHFGRKTGFLMAQAAMAVLDAMYDSQLDLVREGWLDAQGAMLPNVQD